MKLVRVLPTEFRVTPFQERILHALAGRALHTEDLVQELGDPQQFFAGHGGIWELRHWGLVVHNGACGNYRPDQPPASMTLPGGERRIVCGPADPDRDGCTPRYVRQDRAHSKLSLRGRHSFPSRFGRM